MATAVSTSGAKGLMQIKEGTWNDLGCDDDIGDFDSSWSDPQKNIQCGVKIYNRQLDLCDGSVEQAASSYHGGTNRGCEYYNDPSSHPDTARYVNKILAKYEYFQLNVDPATGETIIVAPGAFKIAIDAGHGGEDPGAIGPGGTKEKNINLAIAKELKTILERRGHPTFMTRTTDINPVNSELMSRSRSAGANIFVSIHANSAATRPCEQKGTRTYYIDTGAYSVESTDLAQKVHNSLVSKISSVDGKVRTRSENKRTYSILNTNIMPGILVETLFLCNTQEEAILKDPTKQEQIAEGIANGIEEYMRGNGFT